MTIYGINILGFCVEVFNDNTTKYHSFPKPDKNSIHEELINKVDKDYKSIKLNELISIRNVKAYSNIYDKEKKTKKTKKVKTASEILFDKLKNASDDDVCSILKSAGKI